MTPQPQSPGGPPPQAPSNLAETLGRLDVRLREIETRLQAASPGHTDPADHAAAEEVAGEIRRIHEQIEPAAETALAVAPPPLVPDPRRREIAQALRGLRRRNRIAIGALAASCLLTFGGVGALWWMKAQASKDPIALKFRMPFEGWRNPIEFVSTKTGTGVAAPGSGGANSGGPAGTSGNPATGVPDSGSTSVSR